MIETLPRPNVTAEEYRECEALAMQIMLQFPHHDLGKCLIVRDLCANMLERWLADERMARHEIAARKGTALLAEPDGNIIHLRHAD